jgi:hypothetical protein
MVSPFSVSFLLFIIPSFIYSLNLYSFHSFIPEIYIAPLQGTYSEGGAPSPAMEKMLDLSNLQNEDRLL